MMLNRYQGNSGRVVRIEDGSRGMAPLSQRSAHIQSPKPIPAPPPRQTQRAAEKKGGLGESLSKLLSFSPGGLETEDLILLLILYLMYRESGDSELLIIMGAMFLL